MTRETLVLGAGMVGTSIAYHLARRGRSVTLLDRRRPGEETSYGNAGIIQREAVKPYPFPRDLATLLRVLPNRQIDIRYRPRALLAAAGPLLQYWRQSTPARHAAVVPAYASLTVRCTEEHQALIAAAGAESLVCKQGWLDGFREQASLDAQVANAEAIGEAYGVTHEALDAAALKAHEPHLRGDAMLGAVHWTNGWTVRDPGALVKAYAAAFEAAGGRVERAEAKRLEQTARGWRLHTAAGVHEAEELVLATGPWSSRWLAELGYRVPLFPKRGYHMHYAMQDGARLNHWLRDADAGYLLAPMQAGVRLTTGAELNTLEAPPRHAQLDAAERVARELLPLGERRDAEPWMGSRPCVADMLPVIGSAPRHAGLWLAFGHGHQGFTLGPVTGRVLAEQMCGEPPAVDMSPFRLTRFAL
ncbi:D-amino-acid dehydrogenase [Franzmannia pantelleriensis]|uniref:D-amino-acid dehydrogenase n=1 Tax=Franzmannia pantelleriensis TaxID=48727 RepID=A0A1G9TEH8_9GAMM|nr:FAD-binding oxidoreductase [Halomonas pantelleriensis]SDM46106.1 D-amino-acid dehydrogenase [Halomonas pantelleriensis]